MRARANGIRKCVRYVAGNQVVGNGPAEAGPGRGVGCRELTHDFVQLRSRSDSISFVSEDLHVTTAMPSVWPVVCPFFDFVLFCFFYMSLLFLSLFVAFSLH